MRSILLLMAVVSVSACWVPKETGKAMQSDIMSLQADTRALRKGLDELRAAESEHLQQTLKKFEELSLALQEFNRSARMTDADFGAQMEHMIHDVQELRGAVEVNEHRIGETETKLEETLAQRIEAINKQNPTDASQELSATAESAMPKDAKGALAYGIKLGSKSAGVNDARAVFRRIIKLWPKDAGITDEALYRLAESYFEEHKYDSALREYIKIVEKFGSGNLVDDAYYKIGMCSLELGRLEDAQTFFSEIVANHKKSAVFKSAKGKLEEVSKRIEQARSKARSSTPKKK